MAKPTRKKAAGETQPKGGGRKGRPQIAARLDAAQIEEIERLAALASTPLRKVTKSDVLRYAIELGIERLRAELEGDGKRRPGR